LTTADGQQPTAHWSCCRLWAVCCRLWIDNWTRRGDAPAQRLASYGWGDEEEGVSKRSADALSAAHSRDGLEETRGVIPGTEANPMW